MPLSGKLRAKSDTTTMKKDRNLRFTILGGPGYNPDKGVTLGATSLFSFNTKSMMGSTQRSTVPLVVAMSYASSLGVTVTTSPMIFFNKDKVRLGGQYYFTRVGAHYSGVGFATNKALPREKERTFYTSIVGRVNPLVNFRLAESKWFMGPVFDFVYDVVLAPTETMGADPYYTSFGGTMDGYTTISSGLGLTVSYDSRDVLSNPYSGMLLELRVVDYHKYFGSTNNFGKIMFDYRHFVSLSKQKAGRTLGWRYVADMSYGDVPFMHLPTLGSIYDLRGYHAGQYRDKSTSLVLVEYRHKFHAERTNFWNKVLDRLGFVGWAGVGFMGPHLADIEGVLPNFGAGLRFEIQPRLNFRLDVGYSTHENQALFYFSVTEAF